MTTRSRLNGRAHNAAPAAPGLQIPVPAIPGANDGGGTSSATDRLVANEPVFTPEQLEQLAFRRFNPLSLLTAQYLQSALDGFSSGILAPAARLWWEIAERDETIGSVKRKREEAVALRNWTVVPLDDSPAAADQAAALSNFYRQIVATHALNRHTRGGFSLLLTQMMEAVSYGYTPHHLIWMPNAAAKWNLPSGKSVPTLTLIAEHVPLEYFEARSGELRFLGMNQGFTGAVLVPREWMVTTGPCLMRAASILHYYKRLATHDLVNFSEKFGTPGLVVHTTAAQGSPEGIAAKALAQSLAGNYRGVQYGAPENKVEIVWPSGGTGSASLPMTGIIEDAKRSLAILYLGADLSTMSKGGDGVGASVQGEEQAKRERADCARVSETLNATLDPIVLHWYFGEGCPILAKVVVEAPVNEDKAAIWNLVSGMVGLGAQIPIAPIAKRLNVPVDETGPEFFAPAATPGAPIADPGGAATAANVAPVKTAKRADPASLGLLFARSVEFYGPEAVKDKAPLFNAIVHALGADDDGLSGRLEKLYDALPHIGSQVIAANDAGSALEKILGAAAAKGLTSGVTPPVLDEN